MVMAAAGVGAEQPAAKALLSAPSELLMPVPRTTVRDLLDYASAGMLTHVEPNAAGSAARIVAMDSMRVELQTGSGRTVALQLMPLKKDTAIVVIETLVGDFADSRLEVYDSQWKALAKFWAEPAPSAWGKVDGQEAPIVMAEYSLEPKTGILTLTNTSEDRKKMRPQLQYQWTPKGFKIRK